mgnify:FL=1
MFFKKHKFITPIICLLIISTIILLFSPHKSRADKNSNWNNIFKTIHDNKTKTQLTQEEINTINNLFQQVIPSDQPESEYMLNPICSFFTSYYETPEKMNLERFIEYFPGESSLSDENPSHIDQFEALKKLSHFPFKGAKTIESLNLSINKKTAKSINDSLQKYMGISLKNLINDGGTLYLEKPYEAFYTLTSDAGAGYFTCESGEKYGDIIQLFSSKSTLKIQKKGRKYFIISHLEAE